MEDYKKIEHNYGIDVIRIKIPQHNNIFIKQLFSFATFFFKSIQISLKKRRDFEAVFTTSSRFGTSFLGFVISKLLNKKLALDIRDIFSDSLKSLSFSKKLIGKFLIVIIKKLEALTFRNAQWINFVSPGFLTYDHLNKKKLKTHIFTNGIDDIFVKNRLNNKINWSKKIKLPLTITYAGNIGYGQGLEKTVPFIANYFKEKINIKLIGDGSSIDLIKHQINKNNITNVKIIKPVNRRELLKYYNKSDVLFLQLNDSKVFEKVIPSKIFDYGSFDKPLLAGVKGTARDFLKKHLPLSFIFDIDDLESATDEINKIVNFDLNKIDNDIFTKNFQRKTIMDELVLSLYSEFKK